MKTTQKQAATRFFKKLSALRATLSNEERAILDNLIVVEEVIGHKMTTKATSKATPKASEVAAHKMTTRATDKATSKATSKASEVAAHKMTTKAADKATSKATSKPTFRITFDPNTEEYKIQD